MWERESGHMLQGFYSSDLIAEEPNALSYVNSWTPDEFHCNMKPQPEERAVAQNLWAFKSSSFIWYCKWRD